MSEEEKNEVERCFRAQFQLTWGATLRAVAEHDRELAQRLAQAIVSCVSDLLPTEKKDGEKALKTWGALTNKSTFVLERERKVIGLLLESDKPVKFAQLLAAVQSESEPSLAVTTVVAHLNRLGQQGVIERPGKGRYKASAHSSDYLKMVEDEIARRS